MYTFSPLISILPSLCKNNFGRALIIKYLEYFLPLYSLKILSLFFCVVPLERLGGQCLISKETEESVKTRSRIF